MKTRRSLSAKVEKEIAFAALRKNGNRVETAPPVTDQQQRTGRGEEVDDVEDRRTEERMI